MGDVIEKEFEAIRRKMTQLAKSFPSVKWAPGVDPWRAKEVLRWVCGGEASHGEKVTGLFLLGIWAPGVNWDELAHEEGFLTESGHYKPFDIFEALNVWDEAHHAAFLKWAAKPWYP